jgi:predicted nucleotidyltransferase
MSTLKEIKEVIKPFINDYGITRAGVFGSTARGERKKSSDIDLIFDFSKEFGLLDLCRLKISLEERLRQKVDILEFASLNPCIKDNILKEVVMIYEQG